MGRAADPVLGGLRLGVGAGIAIVDGLHKQKSRGPVAHGSVVAPGAPGPASYLLVGTPLPLTVPRAAALRG